jgi:DNA-binding protein HU-beta
MSSEIHGTHFHRQLLTTGLIGMNTTDLIDRIAAEHGVAKDHVRKILDSTFGAMTAAALRGDEVALSGFGKFKVTERAERQGRNPATGEAIVIPAAKKLSFMPAKNIRDALNAPADEEASAAA